METCLEGAFQAATEARANALITVTSSLLVRHQKQIAELALKNRLPSLFEGGTWVQSGGLMSYSMDDIAIYRRAAVYVNKFSKVLSPLICQSSSRASSSC